MAIEPMPVTDASTLVSLGGLSGQFWSTLIGAVVGAVVGGSISLLIQLNSVRVARDERLAAKRQEDLATAFALTVKVVRVLTMFHHTAERASDASARLGTIKGPGRDSWQVLPPFAGLPAKILFTDREAAFVLSTRVAGLMLGALELEDLHNNLVDVLNIYSRRREELTAKLTVPDFHEEIAIAELFGEELRQFTPYIIQLRQLAKSIVERAPENLQKAECIFDMLKGHCRKRFGDDFPPLVVDRAAGLASKDR